jgi:hypothetical protein
MGLEPIISPTMMKKTKTEPPRRSFFHERWQQSADRLDLVGTRSSTPAFSEHDRRAASGRTMVAVRDCPRRLEHVRDRRRTFAVSALTGTASPRPPHLADQHSLSPGSPGDWTIEIMLLTRVPCRKP